MFVAINAANGLDLSDVTDASFVLSFGASSNLGNFYNCWGASMSYDIGEFSVGISATQACSAAELDNTDGQADDNVITNISFAF